MCSFVAFTRGATERVLVVHRKHNGDRRNIVLPVWFCVVLFLQITLYIIHSTTVNGFCFVCLFCRALHRIIKNMFLMFIYVDVIVRVCMNVCQFSYSVSVLHSKSFTQAIKQTSKQRYRFNVHVRMRKWPAARGEHNTPHSREETEIAHRRLLLIVYHPLPERTFS